VVEESNLFVYLSLLRKTLGTLEDGQPYVETLRRRGYRFNGSVRLVEDGEDGNLALTAGGSDKDSPNPGAQPHGIYVVKDWGSRAAEPKKIRPGSSALAALAVVESSDTRTPPNNDFDNSESTKSTEPGREGSEAARTPKQVQSLKYSKARIALAVIVVIILMAALWFYWHHRQATSNGNVPRTIAILPFRPLNVAGRDEAWELGMCDALITRLSSNHLIVRGSSSVRNFNSPDQDPIAAGKALNVELVLESSYQKIDADHIRVNLRLLNVADGTAPWTDSATEKSTDPFILQEAIAMKVVTSLSLELTDDESKRLAKRPTNSIEAYNYYTLGRYNELTLTDEGLNQAISYFENAIGADPNYALAYAHEADAYRARAGAGFARGEDVNPQRERLARRAMELDGSLPEAYLQLAFIDSSHGNLASAESKFKQVIALNPMEFEAHIGLAWVLARLKKSEDAIAEVRTARNVAPTTPMALVVASDVLFPGHIDEVINQAQRALEIDPNFWVAHLWLGQAYASQKRYPEAISELEKARDLAPTSRAPQQHLALAFAKMGDRERTLEIIDEMNRRFKNNPPSFVSLARIYNSLGDKDKALDLLERALEEHEQPLLNDDKTWDNLRSEPRFNKLLRRISVEK